MKCLPSTVNPIVVTSLLLYIAISKEYSADKLFWRIPVKSAFSQINWLKFSFKLINFSRSYATDDDDDDDLNTLYNIVSILTVIESIPA